MSGGADTGARQARKPSRQHYRHDQAADRCEQDTRVRIALRGPLAARLWRLLGERLTDEEKIVPDEEERRFF